MGIILWIHGTIPRWKGKQIDRVIHPISTISPIFGESCGTLKPFLGILTYYIQANQTMQYETLSQITFSTWRYGSP